MKNRIVKFQLIIFFCFASMGAYSQNPEEGLFSFEPDFRVFTLHAFMNIAGFDHEWRKAGMDTLRLEIRDSLKSRLTTSFIQEMKDFRDSTANYSWSGWAIYGLITNGYPNFEVDYNKATSDVDNIEIQFTGLTPLLKDFCAEINIEQLWNYYKPLLKSRNERYRPYAQEALRNVTRYCKLDDDYFNNIASKIHFQESPLMSYFTAQTVKVDGEIWLINSPSESMPSASHFYHEVLHYVINPLVEKNPIELKRLEPLNELVKDHKTAYEIVIESFVRTFDKILYRESPEKTKEMIYNEYKLGFLLCPYIYESISAFEESDITISEFIKSVMSSVEINEEIRRWEEFNSKD